MNRAQEAFLDLMQNLEELMKKHNLEMFELASTVADCLIQITTGNDPKVLIHTFAHHVNKRYAKEKNDIK